MSDGSEAPESLSMEMFEVPKEARRDLALLEREFVDAEMRLLRKAIPVMRPLYQRRNALIESKLQHADFWPRVFANAPSDIDEYMRPSDAEIISSCLKQLTIDRFEVDERGEGEPRSVRFTFEFSTGDENQWFENEKLVKEFYWRKRVTTPSSGKKDVWEGLVSDPVRIKWKTGMDPTRGMLDAACDLADAEKALLVGGKEKVTCEERAAMKEFEALEELRTKMYDEMVNEGEADDDKGDEDMPGTSFFAWFGFRGKDITAEEAARANTEDAEMWEKIVTGVEEFGAIDGDDDDEIEEEEDGSIDQSEIFPDGESMAVSISEDLWPNALKYYVQSYETEPTFDYDMNGLLENDDDGDDEDAPELVEDDEAEHPRKKVKT